MAKRTTSVVLDAPGPVPVRCSQQNTFALINKLPPEVLSHVFLFHVGGSPPASVPPPPYPRKSLKLGWIQVTHVCRRWRHVALGDPRLWANVAFTLGHRWAEIMLARAKSAPLLVKSDLSTPHGCISSTQDCLLIGATLTARLRQIAAVDLAVDHGMLTHLSIDNLFSFPAPILESIDLRVNRKKYDTWLDPIDAKDPTASFAPLLRRLALRDCRFYLFQMPRFPMLVHFEICISERDVVSYEGMATGFSQRLQTRLKSPIHEELIESLQTMPMLETLILENCFPKAPVEPLPPPASSVELPRLKKIVLKGSSGECLGLLSRLHVPATTSIHLHCYSSKPRASDCLDILPVISEHFTARLLEDAPPPLTLNICDAGGAGLLVRAWTVSAASDEEPAFTCDAMDPVLQMHFEFDSESEGIDLPLLQRTCDTLPLDKLQTLSVDVWTPLSSAVQWSASVWLDMFGRCESVHHVHASGLPATHLTHILQPAEGQKQEKPPILLPCLKKLSLSSSVIYGSLVDPKWPSFQGMLEWLAYRATEGVGIECLYMRQRPKERDLIKTLEDAAPKVVWDEDEDDYLGVRRSAGADTKRWSAKWTRLFVD
ncbi:hypothetical protein BV25DRAFT_436285 [Artomyces pyxidatus]|uniref:Uncharacterized protein n=1 Tax=Artomyces pyxidatus TaxID=48021 RepID=A0ACB8T2Z9_9AGAM|nr:hypothetical protein BV25DRAFT_436285 [Artomyces pyxidatus]